MKFKTRFHRTSLRLLPLAAIAIAVAAHASPLASPSGSPSASRSANALSIEGAWLRATPPQAPVAGGFLTVRNRGQRMDRLLTVVSADAERVEIHSMHMQDGVMRMRRLDEGIAIPARGRVELKPGGLHLMFIGPKRPYRPGETVTATLRFEYAGAREVRFEVRALGATAPHRH